MSFSRALECCHLGRSPDSRGKEPPWPGSENACCGLGEAAAHQLPGGPAKTAGLTGFIQCPSHVSFQEDGLW